jgi:hypothetical protein
MKWLRKSFALKVLFGLEKLLKVLAHSPSKFWYQLQQLLETNLTELRLDNRTRSQWMMCQKCKCVWEKCSTEGQEASVLTDSWGHVCPQQGRQQEAATETSTQTSTQISGKLTIGQEESPITPSVKWLVRQC